MSKVFLVFPAGEGKGIACRIGMERSQRAQFGIKISGGGPKVNPPLGAAPWRRAARAGRVLRAIGRGDAAYGSACAGLAASPVVRRPRVRRSSWCHCRRRQASPRAAQAEPGVDSVVPAATGEIRGRVDLAIEREGIVVEVVGTAESEASPCPWLVVREPPAGALG